ncbi:MAG TPA: autotransporter-associated beta strand repeat-containing protein, partial [Roseimicrobium sp.]|nr:autotransporter-associated beta strand repeat-containing protein [Roseimicrobium sp.]
MVGGGMWTLTGANTYTGLTKVSNGQLVISNTQACPAYLVTSGILTGSENGEQAEAPYISGTLTLGASNVLSSNAIVTTQGGTFSVGTFSSTINTVRLQRGLVFGTTGSLTCLAAFDLRFGAVSASLAGPALLTKSTSNPVDLSGANTFTGGASLLEGVLTLSNPAALGTVGVIAFGGGTLQFTASNTNDYSARFSTVDGQLYSLDTNGQNVALASPLVSATGSLTKLGTGTLTLNAAATYSGATAVRGGTLLIGLANAIPATSAVTIDSPAIVDLASFNDAIGSLAGDGNMQLGTGTLDTGNDNSSTTFSGSISGNGTLTKSGSGAFSLTGSNTYTGGTMLNSGLLALGSAGAIGGSGTISFAGGTLQFMAANVTDYSSRFSTAPSQSYSFDTNSQSVSLASPLTSSGGSLTKFGDGVLTLAAANTYNGGTQINGGTLALGNLGALGTTGTISFGGGTLGFTAANATDYSLRFSSAPNQLYSFDTNGYAVTLSRPLNSPGGSLTKFGPGSLRLTALSTYSGPTTINEGSIDIGLNNAIPATSAVSVNNPGYLNLLSASNIVGSISGDGGISFGGGSMSVGGDNTSTTFYGYIYGNGSLGKLGSGTLTMPYINTYTGRTTINAGILSVANLPDGGNASGIGASSAAATNLVLDGGTLQYIGYGDYTNRLFTLGANGGTLAVAGNGGFNPSLSFTNSGTIVFLTASLSPTLTLHAEPGNTGTLAPKLIDDTNGVTSLLKTGLGLWRLVGNSTYSCATTIREGVLEVGSTNGLSPVSNVTVAAGAQLLLSTSAVIGSLAGDGVVVLQNNTLDTGRNNASTVFSGSINCDFYGGLTKSGSGTFTLASYQATFPNALNLNGGTLSLGGYQTIGNTGTISFGGGALQFTP